MTPGTVSVEISGGLDSAVLGLAAAIAAGPVNTCGIKVIGESSFDQLLRRKELVEKIVSQDNIILIEDHTPKFDYKGRQFDGILHDIYYNSFSAEYNNQIKENKAEWIVSGLGGDEVFPIFDEDIAYQNSNFIEPLAFNYHTNYALEESSFYENTQIKDYSLTASVFPSISDQGNMSLKHGLWLLCPYSEPEIIQFCASLSIEHRDNKNVLREILNRAGLFKFQNYKSETFHDAMMISLKKIVESDPHQCEVKTLARLGIVDEKEFKKEVRNISVYLKQSKIDDNIKRRIDYFASVIHVEQYLLKISERNEVM